MKYSVVTYGEDVLRQKAVEVGEITDDIRKLAKDMLKCMYDAEGVGLAAEQVGRREAICVIDVPRDAEYKSHAGRNDHVAMPLVLVNPDVRDPRGSMRKSEGCLSFPGLYCDITRAETVTVEWTDLEGHRQEATVHGLLARAVQHEVDHLGGTLMSDKLSPAQRLANAGRLRRIRSMAG